MSSNLGLLMNRHLFVPLVLSAAFASWTFAASVPLAGDAPVPVDQLRSKNPQVFSMSGTWRFRLEHGASPAVNGVLPESADAAANGFAAIDANDKDWKDIPVPANWEIEGFSRPTFQDRGNRVSDDIGLYRRWVDVPARFAGQQVLWHFDGVYDGAEVFLDGPGRTTERVQERFGFRKIENRSGVLLWDGVPIKCTGTCRHDEFSPYGHALTEACWKTDVALMKAANINSIRTSHYNHSARLLELCDETGFYVRDDAVPQFRDRRPVRLQLQRGARVRHPPDPGHGHHWRLPPPCGGQCEMKKD